MFYRLIPSHDIYSPKITYKHCTSYEMYYAHHHWKGLIDKLFSKKLETFSWKEEIYNKLVLFISIFKIKRKRKKEKLKIVRGPYLLTISDSLESRPRQWPNTRATHHHSHPLPTCKRISLLLVCCKRNVLGSGGFWSNLFGIILRFCEQRLLLC